MDSYTADTYTVDLMNISSTGVTWDPNYGAVPPVTITNLNGPSTTWTLSDSWLNAPQKNGKITLDGDDADMLARLGWHAGDELAWIDNKDGSWTLTQQTPSL